MAVLLSSSRKYPYSYPTEGIGISWGVGGSRPKTKSIKEMYKA